MEDRVSYETYKGKEIMIVDYSGYGPEDLIRLLNFSKERITSSGRKDFLLIDIVKDVYINRQVSTVLKAYSKEVQPYLEKYAVVGVTGLTKVMATTLHLLKLIYFETFDDVDSAREYVVK